MRGIRRIRHPVAAALLAVSACGGGESDGNGAGRASGGADASGGTTASGGSGGTNASGGSAGTAGAGSGGGGTSGSGPLPEGATGIAAKYAADAGIGSDSAVVFADDFEGAAVVVDLRAKWDVVFDETTLGISTDPGNVNGGTKAVEMLFRLDSGEVGNGLMKQLLEERDLLFLRFYEKFEAGFDVTGAGSFHNGGSISAHYHVDGQSTPGVPADGLNKFLVSYEATVYSDGPPPGDLIAYVYHPEQRDNYGDIFYPTGEVSPNTSLPGNFGPDFVARPNVAPILGKWQCYELMVKANTPGQRDGRIGLWLDGRLIADFPNLRFRDVESLKIDVLSIGGYISPNQVRDNEIWFDDVVAATSYIGPKTPAN